MGHGHEHAHEHGHGHGHGEKFQVPDWKSYKVEGIPELEELQRMLSARGLKDPWIRFVDRKSQVFTFIFVKM